MNPKLCCSGLAVIVFLLSSCGTETVKSDEKTDPVLVEYPVVFIERDVISPVDNDDTRVANFPARNPATFNPGAQLVVKNSAFADALTTNITADLFSDANTPNDPAVASLLDIRDLTVSDDGQEILVSIRAPEIDGADPEEQPSWNLWRYQLANKTLERVIPSDFTAEQGDDLMASFLPDGRIIFASTRQRTSRAILLDEGKPQYTARNERSDDAVFNIHIMNADGSNIKQLSFNLSHDLYPLVLQDGHILYSRWDTMGGNNKINLYQMNPDGTNNHLVYGWHSHQLSIADSPFTIDFVKPQQLPNGDVFLLLSSNNGNVYQKMPISIDIENFVDNNQTITSNSNNTPSNTSATAQKNVFSNDVYNFDFTTSISTSGYLTHLFPLPDTSERYLLSWDLCRVVIDSVIKACGQLTPEQLSAEGVTIAPPAYELWLYNAKDNTQELVANTQEGKIITEAVVMQASSITHEYIADKTYSTGLDTQLANQQAAAIHIRSVYDLDGVDVSSGIDQLKDPSLTPATNLPARFLRIVRGVPLPPDSVREVKNTDFGRSRNQLMREIVGYTPIQPDGSVKVKIPANTPIALSVLDVNGQRIGGRHRQWITLKAGETLECNGCHTRNSELPHGRLSAQADSINLGAISGGSSFPHATSHIIPEQGQTMAQADEMVNGLAQLTANINYRDIWSNSDFSVENASINYQYEKLETQKPTGSECFDDWSAYCRIQINYVEHIQPLWQLTRQVFDETTAELIADNTCTACHSTKKEQLFRVPAAQLDLSGTPSTAQPAHLTSYRELFFDDIEQELIDGSLVIKQVPELDNNGNIVYQLDADDQLILDVDGNPIPKLMNVPIQAALSTNGAQANRAFFQLFTSGSHAGRLSQHELKLISEWLDIGAQYYNTPFYQED